MDTQELIKAAWAVREHSASPYSKFAVGAALRTLSGQVFVGTNVECSSLGLTICAEQAALCAAIAAGETEVVEVAVAADTPRPISPCGACRQLLHDFGPRARVILTNRAGDREETTVAALLPMAFTADALPEP